MFHTQINYSMHVYMYIYICVCVCVFIYLVFRIVLYTWMIEGSHLNWCCVERQSFDERIIFPSNPGWANVRTWGPLRILFKHVFPKQTTPKRQIKKWLCACEKADVAGMKNACRWYNGRCFDNLKISNVGAHYLFEHALFQRGLQIFETVSNT